MNSNHLPSDDKAKAASIRDLRKQPIVKDVVFPATVISKENASKFESPVDSRTCPKWEDAIASK